MEAAGTIIIGGIIDGENGDMPMQAFQWNTSATVAPAKPTRGAYDAGWTPTAPNRPTGTADYFLWMTQTVRHKATDGTITYDGWSTPVRISGDKGTPGEDSSDVEWIYKFDQSGYDGPTGQVSPSGAAGSGDTNKQQAGWVPQGWYDHALAVSSAATTLYASYRRKSAGTNQQWGAFLQPIIWSHYGRNGIDGDGTEYVYIRTKKNVAPVMDSTQSGYDADEFLPTITSASQTASQTEQAQTTDDPKGPASSYPYEWVATRSKVPASQAAADGSRSWSKYTGKDSDYKMSLWAKWAADADETPVYSLVCSPATINFRGNAVGEFAPETAFVNVRVRKVTPSGSTELTPANNVLDGKYYLYYFDQDAGVWYAATNGNAYYEHSVTAEDALSGLITAVPYVLSTSATANNTANGITDANTVARMDVTVVCDGRRGAPGAPGATGKMFFPMGEWDPSVTYTRTGDLLPLVFLTDMNSYNEATGTYGDYWYLGRAESDTGTRPASSANNPWVKANSFGLVITQGIFAEFAKLGKGIFSGDYLFSMNGRIGSTEYLAGATVGDTGRPAYLWFKGDTGASYPVSNLSQSSTTSTTSGAPTPLVEDIVLMKGMSISIRLNIMSSYGTTRIGIRAIGASTFLTYQEWTQSSGYSVKNITYTATTNMVIGIYMYTTGNVAVCKGEGSFSFSGVFEPNWWVDLLTGKMSAARGNFVVDSNGDVHVKSGDVDVSGTIRATNLFRSTALCWGGGKCCLLEPGGTTVTYLYVKSLNRTESPSLAAKYGFAIGDYFPYTDALKSSDDAGAFEDGMNNANYADNDFIPCTYSADAIELLDKPTSQWPSGARVYLPLPSAFAGKMVEVRHNMTSGTGTASVRVVSLGSLITLYPELDEHGKLKVGGNSLTDQCTVNAGQIASFYSTGTYWVACGVVS